MTLHIYTYATDEHKLQYLKETANIFNMNIHYVLKQQWNGFFDKIVGMIDILNKLNDNDIVCFIDAYDVLCNGSHEELLLKFKQYNCHILFGAEIGCFPEFYRNDYPSTNNLTTYDYLNSGGYIGYVHALRKIFSWKSIPEILRTCENGGDQSYFTEFYIEYNSSNIKLDSECSIFQCMHLVNWNEFNIYNGYIYNTILKQKPCFIHFNGGTWQTNDKHNIMPIFIENMKYSINSDKIYTLNAYTQLTTLTCYPHNQLKK